MDENLPSRVKYWLNEAKHDCFFLVGTEDESRERIGAMKTLLMGFSEPFRVMLGDSELAELGDIKLTDVEPGTFRNFLKCVYGASSIVITKLTFDECAKLLYIVEKYLVSDIKSELIYHMEELFSLKQCCALDAISHPICYQIPSLRKKILEILEYHFVELSKEDKFLELNDNAMSWLLQQSGIRADEIEIWNAVLRWAKHKTGSTNGKVLRSCVFDFLKHIRFLTMDYSEFRENVVSSEILLEEEICDICFGFVMGKTVNSAHLCQITRNRCGMRRWASKDIHCTFIVENPWSALIHCTFSLSSDFSSATRVSEKYQWAGHFWRLGIAKAADDDEVDALNVWVGCVGKSYHWICAARVQFRLINLSQKCSIREKPNKTFHPSNTTDKWSGIAFYGWNSSISVDNGLLGGSSHTLEALIELKDS